jgi:outer membrane protein assembly factor BamD
MERFMKLHPASPAIDYAMYLKGVINFNDDLGLFSFLTRQDLSERDQKAAKESFEAFKALVTRFPDSRYTPDARMRMNYIVNCAGAIRSPCGALLLQAWGLSGGDQPRADRPGRLPRGAGARRSPVHHGPFLRGPGHDADARRCPPRAGNQLPEQPTSSPRGFKRDDDPWWKFW